MDSNPWSVKGKRMKHLLLIILFPTLSYAREFAFSYTFKQESIKINIESNNWNKAYELAATKCVDFFVGDKKVSENYFMDVLDVCVNPRERK